MIKITIYGLDQYTVGHYSKNHTKNIANLYEVKEDEIMFIAPANFVLHNGVEQTSWNTIIKVDAPEKYEALEDKVAKYLLGTLKEFSIHLELQFEYFHGHHEYSQINKEYPRFITEENVVNYDENEDDEELYEGNIFEGMEKKLEEAYKEGGHHCDCEDDCDCECDDHCDCEDGECHCGHKH